MDNVDYKILILGGGAVVREYYIPALKHLNLLDSITIIEPDPKASKLLKSEDISVIELKYETFFEQNTDEYNFAIITLPNYLHEDAIRNCTKNHITVLCEKPLSLSSKSCELIGKYQAESNVQVFTGMVRRFMPSFKALKNSLELVGKITEVNVEDGNPFAWVADTYAFFDPKNGGVLADMGVHYLDLLYHLLGELSPVSYKDDAHGGVEANCQYTLKTSNNIPISLKLSRTHTLKNTFEVIGTKGKLWIEKDQFASCYFEGNDQTTHQIKLNNAFSDDKLNYIFESCFVEQLTNLVEKKETELVNIKEATAVVRLIEFAYENRPLAEVRKSEDSYLVTGGTGFIGSALIERLWSEGKTNILAPVRSYKNCAPIARFKIGLPRLNLLDYTEVKESLKDKKYVIHLAYSTDGGNAYEMNVTATQNIVKAACEQGAEAVVILSTMNVYGFPSGVVTENSPQNSAGGNYGKTKKIMQKWCLDFAKTQHKTRIIVLNPTCVYGPNGKTYTTLPRTLADGNRFCWIEEGQGLANVVYIDNLLDAIEKALSVKAAHGQNFIITDGALTWKDFFTPLLGKKAETIPSLKTSDLLNATFNEKTSTKQILRYLLSNFEFVSLINAHPFLGSVKKSLFSKIPSFRGKLDDQRQIVWSALSQDMLTTNTEEKFNPPTWLNELFGLTRSRFSSKKANEILEWKSKISIDVGLKNTKAWLEDSLN
ncbi:NAD-dependent epimerase/dehydratase family protein [Pedobacter insulae]|uniref:Predicted dehydrogenase n=1 Tax=Pedobacter insulae TaxID=414048 RepID=A0A1I2VVJ3_9SPHI|nr:NAD-dependent epimerase/dehydratase family protein [Pedobacter insulae]SFG93103.1 Predicted dehydrogenase [Pedobacter insulae]